jgi:hypothetical protein
MICAGAEGKDACQGDSGGEVEAGGVNLIIMFERLNSVRRNSFLFYDLNLVRQSQVFHSFQHSGEETGVQKRRFCNCYFANTLLSIFVKI